VIHNLDTPLGVDQAVRGSLEIHLAQTTADWEIAYQMLDEEHFLGAGREAATPSPPCSPSSPSK
jgi:hypothetical protein